MGVQPVEDTLGEGSGEENVSIKPYPHVKEHVRENGQEVQPMLEALQRVIRGEEDG